MALTTSKITLLDTPIIDSKCYQYADAALSGKIVVGHKVRQACKRFMDDLERTGKDGYKWEFDIERAQRPIDFIERFCKPSKGDYDRMELLPWQQFVEGNLYGWVDKQSRLRRYREGIIIVGAGNGKSTLVGGNATYAASKDGERGAEVYVLANSKDQAKIIFDECKAQIQSSRVLEKHFRVTRDGIYYDNTRSKIQPLATDSKNLEGRNVHLGIFDEIQDYTNYELINRIKAKTKKRRQPLILYITTLGTVIDGPLMDYYRLGSDILNQSDAIAARAADRVFVYIAEIDEGDDPDDTECWYKANPSLGKLLQIDDLIDEWERVKPIPAERSNFINKQLNVFTAVDELSFLSPETIQKNNKRKPLKELEGERCYGGFDLAETEDFTSACLEFPLKDNDFFVLSHSWVPEHKVRENREKLDWTGLVKEGRLTIVNEPYVDYTLVLEWFIEQQKKYRIDTIGYDPAKAVFLVRELQQRGLVLNEVRQGELTLTAPLDNLKERFLDGNMVYNNDRLLRWYLGNVKLTKRGHNATYLPTKQNRSRKIDGFAALLCAHTEYMRRNATIIPTDRKLSRVIDLGGIK